MQHLLLILSFCLGFMACNQSSGPSGTAPIDTTDVPGDTSTVPPFDGLKWTKAESGTKARLNAVLWTGRSLFAIGDSGTFLTSPNGVGWTKVNTGIGDILVDMVWTGTRFVAVTLEGRILSSENGTAWTVRSANLTKPMLVVGWNGQHLMAVGKDGDYAHSPDGTTWTQAHYDIYNFRPTAMLKADGLMYCIGFQTARPSNSNNYPAMVLGTKDGKTFEPWDHYDPGYDCNSMMAAVWTGNVVYAVGTYGEVFVSSGGSNWFSNLWHPDHYSESAWYKDLGNLYGITWTGTGSIAVGENGVILYSKDGRLRYFERPWTPSENLNFLAVTWTGKRAVAVGSGGAIYYSP